MGKGLSMTAGVGLGAALMYLFDPDRGHRRRTLLQDQATHLLNQSTDTLDAAARDLRHRAQGWRAETRSLVTVAPVPDEILVERVRAKMGRYVSHAHAIDVVTAHGLVTLTGHILEGEAHRLLPAVKKLHGITGVEDRLVRHQHAEDIPSLQGGPQHPGEPMAGAPAPAYWSPSTRVFAVAGGAGLVVYGAISRGLIGAASMLGGGLLAARAITNMDVRRLTGIGAGTRAVDVQKTITINAPVETVFQLWSHYERFPHIMAHVLAVLKGTEEQSRWIVAGPLDMPIGWNAVTTKLVENDLLAWKTLPGSLVQHSGIVRFERASKNTTRVDIRLSYNPVVGALGHLVACLFQVDPKSAMDEDLVRLKSLLEGGKTSAHGREVTREQVAS